MSDRSDYFGNNNIVLSFFLILSLVLLMISDPITVLIGLIIGLVASGLMFLLNTGSMFGAGATVLIYVILVAILLIIKLTSRKT